MTGKSMLRKGSNDEKKSFTTVVLSAAVAMMLAGTTAMAEAPSDNGTIVEPVVESTARFGEFDPNNEEHLRLYNMMENPEENGLVLLDETKSADGDFYVVTRSYAEGSMTRDTAPIGTNKYYAYKSVYEDEAEDILLVRTYLSGKFSWNKNDRTTSVDRESALGMYLRHVDTLYPLIKEYPVCVEDALEINHYRCGYINYTIGIQYDSATTEPLHTAIAVTWQGVQIDVPKTVTNNHNNYNK